MTRDQNLTPQLYLFLATAMEILHADKGNIQLYDAKERCLKIAAHIGFNDDFLNFFSRVREGECCCGQALEKGVRVVVEDTSKDALFDKVGSTSKRFGYAAVQSTPLFDDEERFFGVLSTHFAKPHRPGDRELETLDLYLQKAAPLIARKLAEAGR